MKKEFYFKKWWNINEKIKINLNEDSYLSNTEKILSKSIKNRLISDVPLGAFCQAVLIQVLQLL